MEDQKRKHIVIDSLRSCMSWDSEDLEKDFSEFLSQEVPEISNAKARIILSDFMEISPLERESINFNFGSFLERYHI